MRHPFRQMTCILIDDEPHALDSLLQLVHKVPIIKPLGAFSSAEAGLAFLQESGSVDIVFSDIDMPEVDGIAAGKLFKQHSQFLVYVTGYREHALDAFGAGADAYLLKPLEYVGVLEKVMEFSRRDHKIYGNNKKWLFIKGDSRNSFLKIDLTQVAYIKGMGNYINIHTADGSTRTTYMGLGEVETKLIGNEFLRVNKSTLISLKYFDHVQDSMVHLSDGTTKAHSLGKAYRDAFLNTIREYIG